MRAPDVGRVLRPRWRAGSRASRSPRGSRDRARLPPGGTEAVARLRPARGRRGGRDQGFQTPANAQRHRSPLPRPLQCKPKQVPWSVRHGGSPVAPYTALRGRCGARLDGILRSILSAEDGSGVAAAHGEVRLAILPYGRQDFSPMPRSEPHCRSAQRDNNQVPESAPRVGLLDEYVPAIPVLDAVPVNDTENPRPKPIPKEIGDGSQGPAVSPALPDSENPGPDITTVPETDVPT